MRAKRRSAREVWAERVTRLKESGLTARQFAAKTGLNAQSLRWWRWQLSSKSTSPPSTTRALVRGPATTVAKSPPRISPLTFVEMTAAVEVDRAAGRAAFGRSHRRTARLRCRRAGLPAGRARGATVIPGGVGIFASPSDRT